MSAGGSRVYEQGITVNSQTSTIILSLPVEMTSLSVSGTVWLVNACIQSSPFTFCATERSTARRVATTLTNSIRNEPNGSSWHDWSGWDSTLFYGTRLPTRSRRHRHHRHRHRRLQLPDEAAPVNASNVELTVNTGSNKSPFSKDWPDKATTRQLLATRLST